MGEKVAPSQSNIFKNYISLNYLCVLLYCTCVHTCARVCVCMHVCPLVIVWRSENNEQS